MKEWIEKVRLALLGRRYAYQQTFKGVYAEAVLKDLARFCRAHESTFNADPRIQANLDGRREVWLRLEHHLKLTPEQLWTLYSGQPANED